MTEKAAGADATGMQTTAVKDGNENYVLNGEKWFSSSASVADMALVMAKTDPERAAPPAVFDLHRRAAEPRLQDQARHQEHGDRGPACRRDSRRPLRDRDQGPEGAGRQSARRRRQRLQHGPASPRLRAAAPRHAQRRHGPARARHGGRAHHQALDLRRAARRPPGGAVHARRVRQPALHRPA